ncbi:UDP-glucose 4-epimerase-like [Branchiostoma lanceolatum]|uniref:UDP-glucose 4-epimerase-like n=1 Tax=Branchiostoma lanceolatum TaxID=7740 RepID=UPI003451C0C0
MFAWPFRSVRKNVEGSRVPFSTTWLVRCLFVFLAFERGSAVWSGASGGHNGKAGGPVSTAFRAGGLYEGYRPRPVLVLGGTGFVGGTTVRLLIKSGEFDVTVVTRGNWPWDSSTLIQPYVRHIVCDRTFTYGLSECPALTLILRNTTFEAVLDFNTYTGEQMKDSVSVVKNRVSGFYLYVSSDSVYDVCDRRHLGPTREIDAVRPKNRTRQEELNARDSYGHLKLQGEEELVRQRQAGGFPYVILRLPDVVGPRDSTHRWWMYQLWVRFAHLVPLHLPFSVRYTDFSLVQVDDVAKGILNILFSNSSVYDHAYNLAFKEAFTLNSFLTSMAKELGVSGVKFDQRHTAVHFYPESRAGILDTSKAESILGWNPTTWEKALHRNCVFYEYVMTQRTFKTCELKHLVKTFASDVDSNGTKAFLHMLKDMYDIETRELFWYHQEL